MIKLLFNIVAFSFITNILCLGKKDEDKLLLSPVELIDLVRKEQHKNRLPHVLKKYFTTEASYEQEDNNVQPDPEQEELLQDVKALKNRKVWSRWSKWSDCSVTCGGGTIARHRVCVAGRCAHGEREEQHRPCSRAPCLTPEYNITDEMREFE